MLIRIQVERHNYRNNHNNDTIAARMLRWFRVIYAPSKKIEKHGAIW